MKRLNVLIVLLGTLMLIGCKGTAKVATDIELNGDVFIVMKSAQSIKLALVEILAIPEAEMMPFIQSKSQTGKAEIDKITPQLEPLRKEMGTLAKEIDQAAKEEKASFNALTLEEKRYIPTDFQNPDDYNYRVKAYLYAKIKLNGLVKRAGEKEREYKNKLAESESYNKASFYIAGLPTPIQIAKTDADGKFTLKLKPGKYGLVAFSRRQIIDATEEYFWLIWVNVDEKQSKRIMLSNDNLFETHSTDCIVK